MDTYYTVHKPIFIITLINKETFIRGSHTFVDIVVILLNTFPEFLLIWRSDAASISHSFLTWFCDYAVCMVHLLLVVFLICLFIFTILASQSTNNEGVSLFLSRIFFRLATLSLSLNVTTLVFYDIGNNLPNGDRIGGQSGALVS